MTDWIFKNQKKLLVTAGEGYWRCWYLLGLWLSLGPLSWLSSGTCGTGTSGSDGCIDRDASGVGCWLVFHSLVGWTKMKMKNFFQDTSSNRNSIWVLKNYLNSSLVRNSGKILIICILSTWQCRYKSHSGRRCHWFSFSRRYRNGRFELYNPGQIFLSAYVSRHQTSSKWGDY